MAQVMTFVVVLVAIFLGVVVYSVYLDRTDDEKEFKEMEKDLHIRHIERKNNEPGNDSRH